MPDIIVAADEVAATKLVHDAEATLGFLTAPPGSGSFGPFTATWGAAATLAKGHVNLIAPDVIRITDCELHYSVNFTFSIDLDSFLPHFCLPRVCIPIPFDGRLCTPRICINWPTISVPLSHSGVVKFTADFTLKVHLSGGNWLVNIVIDGIPSLQIDAEAAAILAATGIAFGLLLAHPLHRPVPGAGGGGDPGGDRGRRRDGVARPDPDAVRLGLDVQHLYAAAALHGLAASLPLDPAVKITLDAITAAVVTSDEDELVLTADISPA